KSGSHNSTDTVDILEYEQLFYASPVLPNGTHTLNVINTKEQAWYWLDFSIVTSPIHIGSTGTSTSSPSSNTATQGDRLNAYFLGKPNSSSPRPVTVEFLLVQL
ncbi:hypothetical protein M422DRAFT_39277, partial [Sphaerobolus stellatus SS14]